MKKLLNTLYVTSADSYLALDGENVVILEKENELGRLPLHNLEAIISFGYRGTSPALMGACAERNVSLCSVSYTQDVYKRQLMSRAISDQRQSQLL